MSERDLLERLDCAERHIEALHADVADLRDVLHKMAYAVVGEPLPPPPAIPIEEVL